MEYEGSIGLMSRKLKKIIAFIHRVFSDYYNWLTFPLKTLEAFEMVCVFA
jgi:hypothetical protein